MADASHPFDARRRRPRDWGEAFANLPLETPPLSAWSEIAARLDGDAEANPAQAIVATLATPTPATSPRPAKRALSTRGWLALAASLSALALVPLFWSGKRDASHATGLAHRVAPLTDEAAHRQTATASNTQRDTPMREAGARDIAGDSPVATVVAVNRSESVKPLASVDQRMRLDRVALESAPQVTSMAVVAAAMPLPANVVLIGEADTDAASREMEVLYAASAQLETLLAYTRDPRVETGPAAALSSDIHTRLAKIDAQLAKPGLSNHEQYVLWQARVGTLHQAVSVESELRALSAEGQGYEGQLVEVN
jgi:hypothetical protein